MEARLTIEASSGGGLIMPFGAYGAPSIVKLGTYLSDFGGEGKLEASGGGGGIFDKYNFFMESDNIELI